MASTNAPKAVQIALGVLPEEAARQSFRVPRCTESMSAIVVHAVATTFAFALQGH